MCWSGEASATLAVVGFSTAYYVAKRGESSELWVPLSYFALMELLQAVTYVYIDQCDTPQNQLLTFFGYIHIVFQPFFVNMVAMYFIPVAVKERVRLPVYILCAVGALVMLIKMYPFGWAGLCDIGSEVFCGPAFCSVSGDWHIAWMAPLNGLYSAPMDYGIYLPTYGLQSLTYVLVGFIMPVLYGSWRFAGFHFLIGPLVSELTTSDPNEYAAVWCLFSIALCMSVIKTPIRHYLHEKNWIFYKRAYAAAEREAAEGEMAAEGEGSGR